MTKIFKTLGWIAQYNAELAKTKFGPIGVNLVLMGVLSLGAIAYFTKASQLKSTNMIAEKITVAATNEKHTDQFCLMKGILYPKAVFGQLASTDREWVPMVDETENQVILVRRYKVSREEQPGYKAFGGMVRRLPADVQAALANTNNSIDGYKVNTNLYLALDEEPSKPSNGQNVYSFLGALSLIALVPFAFTFAQGNRFYRASKKGLATSFEGISANLNELNHVFVTGDLAANETVREFMVKTPVQITQLPGGPVAMTTEVNGETFGILFRPTTARVLDSGIDFTGGTARTAVRLGYVNLIDNRRSEILVSFASVEDRAAFLAGLTNLAQAQRLAA